MKCATTTTKIKGAKVRAELKTSPPLPWQCC